ncbi:MAG: ssDNA endodeoxyribonuclease [Bathelium mastoideum]|nr:MAG: ssDNA endodeoxyribonuclease [Bathelium mastoideum]KAI9689884.1 MAG: ssDNA endodeoxyribonuclease [Bathelium mastoideum]
MEQFLLSATSANARQLYVLLRCINFGSFAQVQISHDGLRFSVEETSVMEGFAFLQRSLFTTYKYNAVQHPSTQPNSTSSDLDATETPPFLISLPSLLETLQILGLTDSRSSTSTSYQNQSNSTSLATHASTLPTHTAFSAHILGLPAPGLCRLTYAHAGAPLRIHIAEPGVTTTCDLTTYEPNDTLGGGDDGGGGGLIPFMRDRLALKIITRAAYLADALAELAATGPERLVLCAYSGDSSSSFAGFALEAAGPLGEARVEFGAAEPARGGSFATTRGRDDAEVDTARAAAAVPLLETFQVAGGKCRQVYKFGLVRHAMRAMQVATKVSIRVDEQGVLSLQFMIEVESSGGGYGDRGSGPEVSFVDFRFVPFVSEEGDSEGEDGEETESE